MIFFPYGPALGPILSFSIGAYAGRFSASALRAGRVRIGYKFNSHWVPRALKACSEARKWSALTRSALKMLVLKKKIRPPEAQKSLKSAIGRVPQIRPWARQMRQILGPWARASARSRGRILKNCFQF